MESLKQKHSMELKRRVEELHVQLEAVKRDHKNQLTTLEQQQELVVNELKREQQAEVRARRAGGVAAWR
jgi:hypothetical protein